MELWKFITAVFGTWVEKVGIFLTILPFIEKIPRVKQWLSEKPIIDRFVPALWVIGGICVLWGFYAAWAEEHQKIWSQMAYMAIRVNEPWIPNRPSEPHGGRAWVDFGLENTTQYPATKEATAAEMLIADLAHPIGVVAPDNNPSTPELEKAAWEQMLRDQENTEGHLVTTYDPFEKNFKSAFTKGVMLKPEHDRINVEQIDLLYLVGIEKWESAGGIHAKTFCYWLQPPIEGAVQVDKCRTHNDYIDDATDYLKYVQ